MLVWLEDTDVKVPIALEVDTTELDSVETRLVAEQAVALKVSVVT